jgi:Homeodomain-like domain
MRRIALAATEQAALEDLFKTTADRRLRERCQAVLMASRGRKRRALAQALGGHRTTVPRWLTQYQARGLAGLSIQWAPGQPSRIPETLAPTIQRWVKDGPLRCGLARAHGTYGWRPPYIRPKGSRSSAQRCGTAVSAMAYDPIGRRTGICEATRRSRRRRGRNWWR